MRRTASAAVAVAALVLVACSSDGGALPDDRRQDIETAATVELLDEAQQALLEEQGSLPGPPTRVDDEVEVPDDPPSEAAVLPEGFTTATVEITQADGTVCAVCMWLADSADERGRGLMGVTSLGRPEAMAFAWDRPSSGAFYMFQTVTPLSIAWFAAPEGPDVGGDLVATADMEPCTSEDSAECERFPAGGAYVLAIEVFQGDLGSIGITEGSTARLLPGTEATDCPLD